MRRTSFKNAAWLVLSATPSATSAQVSDKPEVLIHETQPAFRIQVETTVVTVPVVVRDRDGRTVPNLQKKDFRIFDSGKPQQITGFRVEKTTGDVKSMEASSPSPNPAGNEVPPSTPQRFVALFFDDFHTPTEDVARTRNAASRYLSTAVRPEDRVAIFTSSGKERVEFTSERNALHEGLSRIAPHSRTIPLGNQCPSIDEYQAYLIDQVQDPNSLALAAAEAYECHCKGEGDETPTCREVQTRIARDMAAQTWGLAELQSKLALDAIQMVIRRLAAMPGQRILVLASPGFLSATQNTVVDELVNRALGQNVVINAIDSAGLYTRAGHSTRLLGPRLDLEAQKTRLENDGRKAACDVLAGLSTGTGGVFFQNSNDFDRGVREAVEAPQTYYVLSFSPHDVRLDRKFHTLKVTVDSGTGFQVQARRGYFANPPTAPTPNELESLVFSLEDRRELPATLTASPGTEAVRVKVHVDAQALQFRKEGDRNLDKLVFDTAFFDHDGKYLEGKEASLDFHVSDEKLKKMQESGINAEIVFHLPLGVYRIREVVREEATNKLAALNGNIDVKPVPAASASQPPQPGNPIQAKKEEKTASLPESAPPELAKARPELAKTTPEPHPLESTGNQLPTDLALLARIKAKVGQNLKQMPNYTCKETIDRSVKRAGKQSASPLDTIRLEVAYFDGKELYGLADSGKIDQPELRKLVHGTIGGGGFATILQEIMQGAATFHFEGNAEFAGKPAALYTFRVPRLASGYRFTTPSGSDVIGYSGRFWVDLSSLDLLHVELAADEISPELQLSVISESIDYQPAEIGSSSFVLPRASEMKVAYISGDEATNHTSFEDCHQFHAESTLSFTEIPSGPVATIEPPKPPAPAPASELGSAAKLEPPKSTLELPEDFTVDISLETPIDSSSTSVGDKVTAKLKQSIKVEKQVFAPKGAQLSGRIARLDNHDGEYTVEIAFDSLDSANGVADLSKRNNDLMVHIITKIQGTPVINNQGGALEQVIDTLSSLVFKTKHLKLARGTQLTLHSRRL